MMNTKLLYFFFLFFIHLCSVYSFNGTHNCSNEQMDALLLFKQNHISHSDYIYGYPQYYYCETLLGSSYHPITMNWNKSIDCYHWNGVKRNHLGDVIGLNLRCGMLKDICDEHGNPIQLTDEHGGQIRLTDEYGNPMHLTGVATTVGSETKVHGGTQYSPMEPGAGGGVATMGTHGGAPVSHPVVGPGVETTGPPLTTGGMEGDKQQFGRSGSSSSSSSEDDGAGGRIKKKKGLMQKIKEKLPGGHKNKEEQEPEKVYTATTKVTVTTPAGPIGDPKTENIRVEHHEEEHKKGLMEKIKDKLPGHH